MALVSWGCVYHMSWVDVHAAEEWIKEHALQSPEGHVVQDGLYNHGEQVTYGVVIPLCVLCVCVHVCAHACVCVCMCAYVSVYK